MLSAEFAKISKVDLFTEENGDKKGELAEKLLSKVYFLYFLSSILSNILNLIALKLPFSKNLTPLLCVPKSQSPFGK